MRLKIFLLCLVLPLVWDGVKAQEYKNPALVERNRMASSSAIFPFSSRDAALMGEYSVESEYIVPLTEWTSEQTDGGTVFSTRYKVPYKWSDRVVLLRLEGVSNSYAVEVNGKDTGYSQAGLGRVQFDLTKLSQENYNELRITVFDSTAAEMVENSRTHDSAAIGRAFIVSQPKVRIKDLYVDALYDNGAGLFNLGAVMESHLINPKEFTIYYELISPAGQTVAYGDKVLNTQMYSRDSVYFFARVPQVAAWTHESPVLYTLLVRTQYEGRYKEYVVGKVGFTDFQFDSEGRFFVSGHHVPLVPRKASWQGNYAATEQYLRNMKSEGVTLVMVDSVPQPDEFYTLCDRVGLYVCNQADIDTSSKGEVRTRGGNPSNDPEWTDSFVSRVTDMYLSSKNHPSVIAFSLANEGSANGIALYEAYLNLKRMEQERPVHYSSARGEWNSDKLFMDGSSEVESGELELVEDRAADGIVELRNTSKITTFNVRAAYITQRGAVKYSQYEEELTIAPGQTVRCNVALTDMVAGRKNNILDITVYDSMPSFEYNAAAAESTMRVLLKKRLGFYNSPELEK